MHVQSNQRSIVVRDYTKFETFIFRLLNDVLSMFIPAYIDHPVNKDHFQLLRAEALLARLVALRYSEQEYIAGFFFKSRNKCLKNP